MAPTPEIPPATLARWRTVIAEERARAAQRTLVAWHQGRPAFPIVSVADPPRGPGRYHRLGGRPTWYGSSTREGAWAELFRHFDLEGVSPLEVRRRLGRVTWAVTALDLTDPALQARLRITVAALTADDLAVCQALADVAAEAGFDAVLGPSAALPSSTTLAVFGPALGSRVEEVADEGTMTPPIEAAAAVGEVPLRRSRSARGREGPG